MLHLRCPHHGCPIEVEEDMLGARIRCPHCDKLLFVEPEHLEGDGAAATEGPGRGEHGVHEGLPPLSVMLGIREGRVPWADDAELRARMTDEDWRALDAFEAMLRAVAAGRVLLWLGVPVAGSTVLAWLLPLTVTQEPVTSPFVVLLVRVACLVSLGAGLLLVAQGVQNLRSLSVGPSLAAAVWAAAAAALALVVSGFLGLVLATGYDPGVWDACGFALTPLQAMTAFLGVRAALHLRRARALLGAPGVLPRLSDALEHLREAI